MLVKSYIDPCINISGDFGELIIVLKKMGHIILICTFIFSHLEVPMKIYMLLL